MTKLMIGLLAGAVAAFALAGCGKSCSADNCGGCCDADGTCQPGNTALSCGVQGNLCATCAGGQQCSTLGACAFPGGGSGPGGGTGSGTTTSGTNGGSTGFTTGGTTGFTTGGTTGFTTGGTTGTSSGTTTGTSSGTTTGTSSGTTTGTSGGTTTGTSGGNSLTGAHAFPVVGAIGMKMYDGGTAYGAEFLFTASPYTCADFVLADGGQGAAPNGEVYAGYVANLDQHQAMVPGSYVQGQAGVDVQGGWIDFSNGSPTALDFWSVAAVDFTTLSSSRLAGDFTATFSDAGSGSGTFDVPLCN